NKLLKRHHLERCLIRAGLLQHKNNESKTPGQSQGFVSSLKRPAHTGAGLFTLQQRSTYLEKSIVGRSHAK
ncbi:hypothetical protein LC092_20775, partial [Stappia stellulata]|uniref:hypothetical protein n=1 Tax=Stappia stellulata TaxID=71235 RepID=UPI001CD1BED4